MLDVFLVKFWWFSFFKSWNQTSFSKVSFSNFIQKLPHSSLTDHPLQQESQNLTAPEWKRMRCSKDQSDSVNFLTAALCWMISRWWLSIFWMTNLVLPKNGQKMPKCENVKFWIPSQWHSDCVQNFWGRPKSKIGRPVPFWKFQILGCWWWRELLSCVG